MNDKESGKQSPKRGEYALMALIAGAICGWGVILAFALATQAKLSVFGVGSMVAASSMLAGAFFGFLFGVPRTLQKTEDTDTPPTPAPDHKQSPYRPNTNLEQISDWLTKILVGAGLTQIGALRQWLRDIGVNLAPGFGNLESARAFAIVTVLAYLLNGFLIGYLWTRLYLAGALQEADVESLAREIKEIRQQSDLDARALALVIRQLNPSAGSTPPTQQELNDAIKESSSSMKAQIFYQAGTVRSENWSEPGKKAKMERTTPLFRALIASDQDDEYHRNHAQLGYALKDQRAPDWIGAETELSKAIQIRGSGLEHDYVIYEFNRAICRINTDENFKQKNKATAEVSKRIIEDLQIASSDNYTADLIQENQTINDWLVQNDIPVSELHDKERPK